MSSRATLHHPPSPRNLLVRVLETPELPVQIRALPPAALGRLIDEVGLEDAGELVALATTEQLAHVFDEDLWRADAAGEDPRFDSERFLLWLEIMLEAGERVLAERLAELPEDLLTLALHRHLLVLSLDDLRAELEVGDDDAEAAEKALASCLSEELDEYQLIWRGGDGFDTVLAALLALDRDHHSLTVTLLERCAALSAEHLEDNGGLYAVLTSDEMLEQDLAGEREERRARRGHVAPSAAVAFLRLARDGVGGVVPPPERDPLTRAYFRELERELPKPRRPTEPAPRRDLSALLEASGVLPGGSSPRRLTGSSKTSGKVPPLLSQAMRELGREQPRLFAERSEELAYLSNVLLAAGGAPNERLPPLEAVEQAIECVSLGLLLSCGARSPSPEQAAAVLAKHPCDALFRLALGFAARGEPGNTRKVDAKALLAVRALLKRLKI